MKSLVALLVAVLVGHGACAHAANPAAGVSRTLNPATWIQQARFNAANNKFYATDLTVHDTRWTALSRSFAPTDLGSNVSAALQAQTNPLALLINMAFPVIVEVQRQLAAGHGMNPKELAKNLDLKVLAGGIAGTLVGGTVGGVSGAAVQSLLAGLGPAGAVAGFIAQAVLNFTCTTVGMQFGQGIGGGQSLRESAAQAIEAIRPTRDIGQALGTSLGYALGQVLIPVPIVGGVIGAFVGGTVGAAVANLLLRIPAVEKLDSVLRSKLAALARMVRGSKGIPSPGQSPPAPQAPAAPASASTEGGLPADGTTSPSTRTVPDTDGLSMDDLPLVSQPRR